MQRLKLNFAIIILTFLGLTLTGQEKSVQEQIDRRINEESNVSAVMVDGKALFSQVELVRFYANRNYEPAWTQKKNITDLIESLEASYDEGLDPEDYHLGAIKRLTKKKGSKGFNSKDGADLELLLTDALILYGSHLLEGKLEQSELRKKWDVEKNEVPENIDSLLTATLHNKRVKGILEEMKPSHYMYKLMKFQLKKLRGEAESGGWPKVSDGETLKPGMSDPRVKEVRDYLKVVGDLDRVDAADEELFDEELEEAVKRFQIRHKLSDDGAVGKGTIQEMNVTVEERIDMIRLNLERLRWIFHHPDKDFLIVNIAGFHVKRITNKEEVFDSRVIVGKYHHKTPVFKGVMNHIIVNPTWTLPYSIATRETLPKLKKDPGYLAAKHMEVLDRSGKVLNASTIDWSQYSAGNFPFTIRQKAGPWNALGEVKFMFPNKYAVYLHDTPSRGLFNQQDRAFSHGCIRTESKWELLMSLMDDPDEWNMEKINEILKSGKTTRINLPKPINIYLIYLTAAVNQNNDLIFARDIYKRDPQVLSALNKSFWE